MRSTLFSLGAIVPAILACDSPTHACPAAFTAASASAMAFCATYTTVVLSVTSGLPAFAAACGSNPKKLSSACSCLMPAQQTSVVTASFSAPVFSNSSIPTTLQTYVESACTKEPGSATLLASTSGEVAVSSSVSEVISSSSVVVVGASIFAFSTSAAPVLTSSSSATPKASSINSIAATTSVGAVVGSVPASCTASEYAQITSVVAACTQIVLENISAPASSTILLNDLIDGSTVTFAGTTTFGTTIDSDFDPVVVSGTEITITGAAGHVIEGNGAAYWDGQGSNGGTDKPNHFIVLSKMTNGVVTNLNIKNWPVHCFYVSGCTGMLIDGLTMDNSAGEEPNSASGADAAAHNSDGFNFGSSNDIVLSNTNVKNQDDCVAVTSGVNVTITGMTCSGGHGLSIGSVGGKSNNVVQGVTFSDSTITDSSNGARIKTNSGTTGSITDITYENIVLTRITDYGIDIQQDYLNGGPTGEPTNGVTITGVTMANISGTMTDDGINVYILCGDGSCSDFTFTDVTITGGGVASSCNYPSTTCPS